MERFLKYRHIPVLIYATIFTLFCIKSMGQVVSAKAVLDTNQALIGDQLGLRLILEKPEDVAVTFPEIHEDIPSAYPR